MRNDGRPTGLHARNGEIHVGDSVRFDDGWLCIVVRITEHDGKIGFFLEDDLGVFDSAKDFWVISGNPLFCEMDGIYADFEILPDDHGTWYGIHAPLYEEAYIAARKFEKGECNT